MLSDAKVQHIADIADAGNLADSIQSFVQKLSERRDFGVEREFAMTHSRKSRTRELALLLDGLTKA
jgi:hypothetical protein